MTLQIRTLAADEMEEAVRISADAFNSDNRHNLAPSVEQARVFYQPDWHLAAFEDGEMTAMMPMLPFAMRINGRAIPFAAVGPVASSPLHRRKGHTGAMLRRSLEVMRERGQVLSGLYTPHPMLYRRYGWEIAAESRTYTFKPKEFGSTVRPSTRGRLRSTRLDDWPALDAVYRRYSADRNGPLHRGEVWWKNAGLGGANPQPFDAVLWEDAPGSGQGYVVYTQPNQGRDAGKIVVREFVSLTGDAYLNLLSFLAGHDLAGEIVVPVASEDPFVTVFQDAQRLDVKSGYTVLLRVCDFEGAMNRRAAAPGTADADVTLEIDDQTAPWNAGVWRVGVREGACFAERADDNAEMKVSANVMAPVFNGHLRASGAARAGLLRAASDDALARADRIFAVDHQPYFTDFF